MVLISDVLCLMTLNAFHQASNDGKENTTCHRKSCHIVIMSSYSFWALITSIALFASFAMSFIDQLMWI